MTKNNRYGFVRNTTSAQAYLDVTRLLTIATDKGNIGSIKVWSNKQTATTELLERSVGDIEYVEGFR